MYTVFPTGLHSPVVPRPPKTSSNQKASCAARTRNRFCWPLTRPPRVLRGRFHPGGVLCWKSINRSDQLRVDVTDSAPHVHTHPRDTHIHEKHTYTRKHTRANTHTHTHTHTPHTTQCTHTQKTNTYKTELIWPQRQPTRHH